MTLIFESIYFILYVFAIWIYVCIATLLLTPKGKMYFRQRLNDPITINARNSQLVSLFVCGLGTIMVLLLLTPFFITIMGMPDWIDFVIAFSGAAIIEVYAYSQKSHAHESRTK